jgi:hypothetical protein
MRSHRASRGGTRPLNCGVRRTEIFMRKRACTAIFAGAVLLVFGSSAQDSGLDDELEQLKESLATVIAQNTTSAYVYDANGFRIESSQVADLGADLKPNGNQLDLLSVTSDGAFQVVIEKGRPGSSTGGGVGLHHRKTGASMLSVGDRNGDGRLDILTYGVVDEDGNAILDVVDYEADGQPDMRIHFVERYFEIWHVDRWYRTELRDGRRGIVVDGEFVELRNTDNRWVVP